MCRTCWKRDTCCAFASRLTACFGPPELDAHVHVCAAGSEWERTHLLFRDWLRISPGDCKLYAAVKEGLAGRLWPDMNDYAAAKTDVIADIIGRAERWSAETRWTPA